MSQRIKCIVYAGFGCPANEYFGQNSTMWIFPQCGVRGPFHCWSRTTVFVFVFVFFPQFPVSHGPSLASWVPKLHSPLLKPSEGTFLGVVQFGTGSQAVGVSDSS